MREVITSGAVHVRSKEMPNAFAADAFKRAETWARLITNQTARNARRHLALRIRIMLAQKRVEQFLRGKGQVLGLVGHPGTGKMFGTRLASEAVGGFSLTAMDRAQGVVNYNRLGAYVLGDEGLAKSLFVVCNADAEIHGAGAE